jgi:hypothetical protein
VADGMQVECHVAQIRVSERREQKRALTLRQLELGLLFPIRYTSRFQREVDLHRTCGVLNSFADLHKRFFSIRKLKLRQSFRWVLIDHIKQTGGTGRRLSLSKAASRQLRTHRLQSTEDALPL